MKKSIAIILITVLMLSFAACGAKEKKDEQSSAPVSQDTSVSEQANTSEAPAPSESTSQSEKVSEDDLLFEADEERILFSVSTDFEIESDAWLGVIPTGKIYENEVDADEVDIIYTYCENLDEENAAMYIFAFEKSNFFGIEDGIYDMILCSSDNAETGKVLIQIGLEKNGESIVLDYENSK